MNTVYPPSRPMPVNDLARPAKPRKRSKIGQTAHSILDGSFLTREKVIKLIPFILYLMFLAIVHIASSYRTEKTWLEINRLKDQMDELRYHYITSKSELMSLGRQSEVATRLEHSGIREATVPPVILNPVADKAIKTTNHD